MPTHADEDPIIDDSYADLIKRLDYQIATMDMLPKPKRKDDFNVNDYPPPLPLKAK